VYQAGREQKCHTGSAAMAPLLMFVGAPHVSASLCRQQATEERHLQPLFQGSTRLPKASILSCKGLHGRRCWRMYAVGCSCSWLL
jgi:hypothetical protein